MKATRPKLAHVFMSQIIEQDCYGIRRYFDNPPQTVLDIGCNVGFFSLYARVLFPQARIIAIEPCEKTLKLTRDNLSSLKVDIHLAGLSLDKKLSVVEGRDSGCNFTRGSDEGDVPGLSLRDMVSKWEIDPETCLMKVDCEGGEIALMDGQSDDLLRQMKHITLETHYRDRRGEVKWPMAPMKEEAEMWLHHVDELRGGEAMEYHETSCAGIFGGMAIFPEVR